jgi:catechol 2,3-dioxygenase-like lactoylglutathione lyase family enzyme
MRARWIAWALASSLLAAPAAVSAGHGPGGLGVGRGVDHVGTLVRLENFDAAVGVLTDQLGFSATAALLSPFGAENRLIWFDDLSYLEVDAVTEANPFTQPFLDFLADHEGAKFYGTEVLDADRAAAFLTAAGYPNTGLIPAPPLTLEPTDQTVGATPLWQEIILTSRLAPDNSNFFIDYDEAAVQQMFQQFPVLAPRPHANTARHIDTLWLVVADLEAAIDYYRDLGLQVTAKDQKISYLGGRGALVQLHNATLALLQPDGPGLVADFAADRGEGILGLSIQVASLSTAHRYVESHSGLALPVFKYRGRDRFLIPSSLAHGVLIEMVE